MRFAKPHKHKIISADHPRWYCYVLMPGNMRQACINWEHSHGMKPRILQRVRWMSLWELPF